MEDRNIEFFLEAVFNFETTRGGNVFEINATESGRDRLDGAHDLVRVFRIQTNRKGIDAAEFLEEHRLAFHHRHGRRRPNIPKPKHRCSISYDGHGIFLDCKRECFFRILTNRFADTRDARSVSHRKIGASLQGHLRHHFDLATNVHEEGAIRDLQDLDASDSFNSLDDLVFVFTGNGVDGDIANDVVAANTHNVYRTDVAPRPANRGRDFAERARTS